MCSSDLDIILFPCVFVCVCVHVDLKVREPPGDGVTPEVQTNQCLLATAIEKRQRHDVKATLTHTKTPSLCPFCFALRC